MEITQTAREETTLRRERGERDKGNKRREDTKGEQESARRAALGRKDGHETKGRMDGSKTRNGERVERFVER